jgi:hypothetical protein
MLAMMHVVGMLLALAAPAQTAVLPDTGYVHNPFTISIMPYLSTNLGASPRTLTNLSLNGIGLNAGVEGFEAGLVLNVDLARIKGLQAAGGANFVGGNVAGVQGSGIFNAVNGRFDGIQAAGIANITKGPLTGLQFSIYGGNLALDGLTGLQATFIGLNYARGRVRGLQGALGINVATGTLFGGQASLINVAGDVTGAQVGLVNVARNVTGAQVGLVNISRTVKGVPFGPLCVVTHGRYRGSLWVDDFGALNASLRTGPLPMYYLLTYGRVIGDSRRPWNLGFGAGFDVPFRPFFVDADASVHWLVFRPQEYIDDVSNAYRFRLVYGWQPLQWVSLFAGPVWTIHDTYNRERIEPRLDLMPLYDSNGTHVWMGLSFGVECGN